MSKVAKHLGEMWQHHAEYRRVAGTIHGASHPKAGDVAKRPDFEACAAAIEAARACARKAHALDPEHTDPAWTAGKRNAAEMLAFFERYCTQVADERAAPKKAQVA